MSRPTDASPSTRNRPDATGDKSRETPKPTGNEPAQDFATQAHAATHAVCLQSEALLNGRNSVEIAHLGAIYRLQATRQGKLILTK